MQKCQINFVRSTHAVNLDIIYYRNSLPTFHHFFFRFDIPNLEFKCKILIDRLHLVGLYTVVGKILLAPIQGQGTFTVNTSKLHKACVT